MVYLLFFLSGFAGLVYEVSWSRQIGLLFGHTANAAAVVLGAYFGGMALGSWAAARLMPRFRRPLAGYGGAELLVALWAILTPLALQLLRIPAVASLLNYPDPAVQTAIRAVVAFAVLLPATVPLGATLPFIAQHVSGGTAVPAVADTGGTPALPRQSRRIALAYALNTAGALCGAFATTYALILLLGVTASSYFAAGLSALCGVVALWLARRSRQSESSSPRAGTELEPSSNRAEPELAAMPIPGALYALAALSGFGALGLQVLYTHLFALILHNSTYTFGSIVLAFLAALALAGGAVADLRIPPQRLIGWGMLLGALAIPTAILLLRAMTGFDYLEAGGSFAGYMAIALGLVLLTVLPPVFLLGLVLPALWASARGLAGNAVGRLTAVNTLAATAGVLATAFVILPLLGLWASFAAFSLAYAAAGLLCLRGARGMPGLAARVAVPALTLLACVLVLRFAPQRIEYARRLGYEFAYLRDTPYGQVDVQRKLDTGDLRLRQNRFYTLGASDGADFELLQGALPLLLHPAPRQVCYLGLATGITASAALRDAQVQHVTTVELIPEVAQAARLFSPWNDGIMDDPRSEVTINDARHYLYAGGAQFDVIISDLFVPWHSQTGYLYTVEHYRTAAARLAPGGLFFQWLPAYQLSSNELQMIADSFATVFPCTSVWVDETYPGALIGLAGSSAPIELDSAAIDKRCASSGVAALGSAASLEKRYAGDWTAWRGAVLNTDEHPRVEFLSPISERSGKRLLGALWDAYRHDVLGQLPRGNIQFSDTELEAQ